MLTVDFDFSSLLSKIDAMEAVIKKSIRPAAKAGAQVFYDEVQARALSVGGFRLYASIYQKFVIDSATGTLGDSATYHVSWRKQAKKVNVKAGKDKDDEEDNAGGLVHTTMGFWIEFGRWQRYMARTGEDGEWYTVAKPFKKKADKPGRYATQAQKDAYWMPRKGGPVFHAPKSFLRSSYEAKKTEAAQAVQARMVQLLKEAGF